MGKFFGHECCIHTIGKGHAKLGDTPEGASRQPWAAEFCANIEIISSKG